MWKRVKASEVREVMKTGDKIQVEMNITNPDAGRLELSVPHTGRKLSVKNSEFITLYDGDNIFENYEEA